MRTEVEIERRMAREYLVSFLPMMLFFGAALAFYLDGSWQRAAAAALAASICIVIGGIRRSILTREQRLAKNGMSD